MKRLISTTLALSLLSGTVAYAEPQGHGWQDRQTYRDDRDHHDWDHRRHHDDGAAIAAGVGLIALFAIMASQNNRDDRYARDRDCYERDRDGDRCDRYDGHGYEQHGGYGPRD